MSSQDYADIVKFMDQILEKKPQKINLDLTALNFLNSSGINVLAKFVIAVRKNGEIELSVLGSHKIPWQGKSLPNLKKTLSGPDTDDQLTDFHRDRQVPKTLSLN